MNHFWSATSSLVTIYFVSLILIGSYFALNLVLVRAGPHSDLAWGWIARFSSISHTEDTYTAGSLAQYCWWLFFSPEFFFAVCPGVCVPHAYPYPALRLSLLTPSLITVEKPGLRRAP
jgi:hypothetical protein